MTKHLKAVTQCLVDAVIANAGRKELGQFVSEGGDVNELLDLNGWTLLQLAAEHENVLVTKALIALGADVDLPDPKGTTPLMQAIDIAIDGHVQNDTHDTPLRWDVAIRLLRAGANPDLLRAGANPESIYVKAYGEEMIKEVHELVDTFYVAPNRD